MMKFQKLFIMLKQKNIKLSELIASGILSPSTLQRLRHDKPVSLHTLEILCRYLGCGLGDITSSDHESSPQNHRGG